MATRKTTLTDYTPLSLGDADRVRMTPNGYMVAAPRVARTGIQLYADKEIGVGDSNKILRIYRPDDEVFNDDSMRSFAHKPVTDDHPPQPVDSKNWREFARGQIGDEVARDGDFIRVPMVLMDHGLIAKVKDGKAELSVGYTCDLDMTAGTTPSGEAYDGVQRNIRVNHTAVVNRGRAGSMARIGDGSGGTRVDAEVLAKAMSAAVAGKIMGENFVADSGALGVGGKYLVMRDNRLNVAAVRAVVTDSIVRGDGDVTAAANSLLAVIDEEKRGSAPIKETNMTKHVVDGITVEMDDTAIQVVDKTIKTLQSKIDALDTTSKAVAADHTKILADKDAQIAKLTTDLATVTTEKATLETKLKDATVTPQRLEQMVADRQAMIGKAKAIYPSVVVDGKTDADIRKQVVDAKVGDAAKDWSDDTIKVSFDTLAASVPDAGYVASTSGNLGDAAKALANPVTRNSVYDKRDRDLENAWKGKQAGQA